MTFSLGQEYPGFAVLVIFPFLALRKTILVLGLFFSGGYWKANPRHAITCGGTSACTSAEFVFLSDPRPKLMN